MSLKVKSIDNRVFALLGDFYRVTEGVGDFIMNTTTTRNGKMSLATLTEKILADPENVNWVLEGGFFDGWPDPSFESNDRSLLERQFDKWRKGLIDQIRAYNIAVDRLNGVAAAAASFIDQNYPGKLPEKGA